MICTGKANSSILLLHNGYAYLLDGSKITVPTLVYTILEAYKKEEEAREIAHKIVLDEYAIADIASRVNLSEQQRQFALDCQEEVASLYMY